MEVQRKTQSIVCRRCKKQLRRWEEVLKKESIYVFIYLFQMVQEVKIEQKKGIHIIPTMISIDLRLFGSGFTTITMTIQFFPAWDAIV